MADVQDVQAVAVQTESDNQTTEVKAPQEVEEAKFTDFPFADSVLQDIEAAGFERPTPIQAACIPTALEGKDLIGLAQTGTGKTAAFSLPIIQKLAQSVDLGALVLTPTRELAMQVTGVLNQLGKSSSIRVATIVGGIPMDNDYKALRSWPNVLVATPGRLIDHLTYGSISLKEIQVLVVDEADRMHDMGFIPQIRRILDELPSNRQTMMFTATMPKDVERIARMSMRDPVRIQVGRQVPAEGAKQQLFRVRDEEKGPLLMQLLSESEGNGRVLIFVRTKRGCDKLHRIVCRRFRAARIHGDREQRDRDDAMSGFREGRYRILIATDIAARGIDVADIEHVINYDFPLSAEDYVHRIGRTARQQATGLATSLVTSNDRRFLLDAYKLLGDKLPLTDDLKDLLGTRSRSPRDGRGGGNRREAGRAPARTDRQAQPDTEVVRNHRPDSQSEQVGGEAGPRRKRRSRGRRGRTGQPVASGQPAASSEARQPHQSHDGRQRDTAPVASGQPEASNEARPPRQSHDGRRQAPRTANESSVPARKGTGASQPRKAPRRKQEDDDCGVVILDRCDDGPDGIVGEENRRGRYRRGGPRRPRSRRAGKDRGTAKGPAADSRQDAAQ